MRLLRTGLFCGLLLGTALAPALAELSSNDWHKAQDKVDQALKRGDARGAGKALLEVASDDSDRAAKLVAAVAARFPDDVEIEDRVTEAASRLRSEKALAELRKELASPKTDWRYRVLLVDVLAARGKAEQPSIVKALEDKQEEIQRAATRQLAKWRTEVGLRALCGAMEQLEQKRRTAATWQDMRNALMRALGVELPGGGDYRNYLDAHRDRFVEGQGIPPDPSASKKEAKVGETVCFGTELYCKNVVLIIDISGSMELTDPYPPGMDVGSKPREYVESNGMKDPERQRIRRARKELVKLLDQLAKAKGKVNIVAFSTDVAPWRDKGLHELGETNLKSAKDFVEKLKPDGVTATESALACAFDIAPQADCFYFISDGKANNGEIDGAGHQIYIPAKTILDATAKLNKVRKVQINTFGFIPPDNSTEGADVELMSGLAAATGGTYTEIR